MWMGGDKEVAQPPLDEPTAPMEYRICFHPTFHLRILVFYLTLTSTIIFFFEHSIEIGIPLAVFLARNTLVIIFHVIGLFFRVRIEATWLDPRKVRNICNRRGFQTVLDLILTLVVFIVLCIMWAQFGGCRYSFFYSRRYWCSSFTKVLAAFIISWIMWWVLFPRRNDYGFR
jgi:hypothetical protein